MRVLVPNLGSTSLKYQLIEFPGEDVLAKGRLEKIGQEGGDAQDYRRAIERALDSGEQVDAVGFKAVHAGPEYRGAFRIDDGFLNALKAYEPAAPLHNGIYLGGIRTFQELRPELPLVAVVETGFHRTVPPAASTYGVPRAWESEHGIRRYGFHGASHTFMSRRVPEFLDKKPESLRIISCHLGGSSSICAIKEGKSFDVTMGFSPQSGLENATRHGDLDPFAVLFLMERLGWSAAEAREQLLKNGGLAGISGVAGGDLRDVQEAATHGSQPASLAMDVLAHQVRKTIGAYAAVMGGVDAIAFTGGIGENSTWLRAQACRDLEFMGVKFDSLSNLTGEGDRLLSRDSSQVKVLVLTTNEELIVAREAAALLA